MHRLVSVWLLASTLLLLGLATTTIAPVVAQQEGNTCDVQGGSKDCPNGILAGANLAGTDLSDANLADTDLHGANLQGAILTDANLERANLTDADLSGATLTRARLSTAILVRTNLMDADIGDVTFAGATFGQTICPDGHLTDGPAC
jgi:uncharacterized protein YjbI with pentapeptide repeats